MKSKLAGAMSLILFAFAGLTSTLNLTVLHTIKDNYAIYVNDGIDDAWQTRYFGQNNPAVGQNEITDGSGLTNLFRFAAGHIPNNATSTFLLGTAPGDRPTCRK